MANLTTESSTEILDRAIRSLSSQTQITKLTPGGKARSLLGIMANEVERIGDVLTANTVLTLLNGASGPYLEFIGALVGVYREQRSSAEAPLYNENVKILAPQGLNAGNLNNGRPITIPGGTAISSADGTVTYYTTHTAIMQPADTEVFVGARATIDGPGANVAAGTLTRIGFTNYASYPNRQLSAFNLFSISNGRQEESDQILKYRIQNAYLAAESGNLISIRLAALSVSSVSDMTFLNMYRGVGTADLVLDTTTGDVSATTLQQVRGAIANKISVGVDVKVRAPKLIGLEVTIRPRFAPGVSNVQRVEAADSIRQAISDLVAQVPIGGTLLINDIGFAAKNASPHILDVGRPNKPLEEVLLWRESRLAVRAPLILPEGRDIELTVDQRLSLEGGARAAIRIL